MMASPFCHGDTLFAQRAFFRLVRRNRQVQQGLYLIFRHAEFSLAAAAVDEEADTDDDAAGFFNDIDDFLNRSAGGYDIFDDKDPFTRFDMETAAQGHDAFFSFREDSPRSEGLADFMRQEDAAGHGSHNGLYILILKAFRQFLAKLFRIFRMLKDIEFFDIERAVQSRCQEKMTFQHGLGFD